MNYLKTKHKLTNNYWACGTTTRLIFLRVGAGRFAASLEECIRRFVALAHLHNRRRRF